MRKYCSSAIILSVEGHNTWAEFGKSMVGGQSCFPRVSLPSSYLLPNSHNFLLPLFLPPKLSYIVNPEPIPSRIVKIVCFGG